MTRIEKDSIGEIELEDHVYWGTQTERSRRFFTMGWENMPFDIIKALVIIKRAAAHVNGKLNCIPMDIAQHIIKACDDILVHKKYTDQFPLRVWQTGSGTQTNMNVNEVIANIANVSLGQKLGSKHPVHPNDHVNFGQSSNDCFPTAMHISAALVLKQDLIPALLKLHMSLLKKANEFKDDLKIARTHLQDATPMTVGQEFATFARQIELSITRIKNVLPHLLELSQGGTAVGTGLNTHELFAPHFIEEVNTLTGLCFTESIHKFEGLSSHDAMVEGSGALNTVAVSLMKIANDIRLLASGPRAGLNELYLPENEPGSSIMPGKVNPTQAEAMTMIAAQVMGNHMTITVAGSHGHLQLNVFKPVIAYNFLQSVQLLSDVCLSFAKNCVKGIHLNKDQLDQNIEQSLMLATSLNRVIGYDKASMVAKNAFKKGISLKESAMELGFLTTELYDEHVNPKDMLHPFS